ncbi:YciI family protein [Paracoccus pantotrophus]|uniref:YciI family protein n=1 Tax=Paracoccus pantotrophus TaxID=82367 RepID=A0A7H9BPS2_PARPN|nr:YciI family protein [Paracoccus pantotrophus]QLH13023.1 YciI family protein [Paracoccus pantotrophus]
MHFAVYCLDHDDTVELRNDHRAVHRAYLDTQAARIFFSGPLLADDGKLQLGSLFILSVGSRAEAEDFIGNEPYNNAGIFKSVRILRMRKGRYDPEKVCHEAEAPLRFDPFE